MLDKYFWVSNKLGGGGSLNKQGGLENSVKYNKLGGWNKRGFFGFFDPNNVNVSKIAYVQTKL